jgi:uncharacterized Zn-finger protein
METGRTFAAEQKPLAMREVVKKEEAKEEEIMENWQVFMKEEIKEEPVEDTIETDLLFGDKDPLTDMIANINPFEYSLCTKSFAKLEYPNRQKQKVHTIQKSKSCSLCKKEFSNRKSFLIHMQGHTGEKSHSCPHCNKAYVAKSLLLAHIRTHTGERPFSCSQCTMTFSNSYMRTRHMKTHTGEKPYSCTQCEKSFSQLQHLQYHMTIHTGLPGHFVVIEKNTLSMVENHIKN